MRSRRASFRYARQRELSGGSRASAAAIAALLALGGCGDHRQTRAHRRMTPDAAPLGPAVGEALPESFAPVARRVTPSVVSIRSTTPLPAAQGRPDPLWGAPEATSLGSGIILSADGEILTNEHVIADARRIVVKLDDGHEVEGEVVGEDQKTDLALVRVAVPRGERLVPAPLGDSDLLRVGEWVVAVGDPFGLEHTVTAGIVSAKGRTSRDVSIGPASRHLWDFIQTDASINPGNSGGPLVNMAGEVVGINTAINPEGEGIGFAIPINLAKRLLPMLVRDGHVTRAFMGVLVAGVTDELAARLGFAGRGGALVVDVVPRGPADRAGVKPGDIVLEFDGQPVDDQTLQWVASMAPIGKKVQVVLWRGAEEKVVDMVTEELRE